MRRKLLLFALLAFLAARAAGGEAATVEAQVKEAKLDGGPGRTLRVLVEVKLAPAEGVHLYRDKVTISALSLRGLSQDMAVLPPAHQKAYDENEGREVAYYTGPVSFTVPLRILLEPDDTRAAFTLRIGFQGCTGNSCFPPETREFKLEAPVAGEKVSEAFSPTKESVPVPGMKEGWAERAVKRGGLLGVIGAFVLGLLISFTPCVYPMVPVTVAVIGGAAAGEKRGKAAVLGYTLIYILGISITYTILGLIAAYTGTAIGSLGHYRPLVIAVGLVMFALALSMFGAFDLALPGGLAGRLGVGRGGGSLPWLLLSGLVLGLVASPCVSAPLLFLLTAIGASGNPVTGAASLFAFAWGMSALLIIAGVFPGWLARPGAWMNRVKLAFGAILAVAGLYFVKELLPRGLFGWPGLAAGLAAGVALLVAARRLAEGGRLRGLVGGLGGIALVSAAYLGLGLAVRTGAWLRAAQELLPARVAALAPSAPTERLRWQSYTPEAFDAARAAGRPVVVDFYATWCHYCLELDRTLFSDPEVAAGLEGFVLLRVDDSEPNEPARRAVERFHAAFPTVLVFSPSGEEAGRFLGDARPGAFLEKLRAAR